MPSHYPYRWLVAASLTLSVSGSIIAQERDPFLPPEVPSNAAEQNSPAPRLPERSEVAPMPEQTWLSQPDLQQQYGEQIAATIIKRSRFVGTGLCGQFSYQLFYDATAVATALSS